MAHTLTNIGDLYIEKKQFSYAFRYLNKALKIAEELKAKSLIKDIYKSFSDSYTEKRDFRNAYHYYKKYAVVKDEIVNKELYDKIAEMQVRYEAEKREKEIVLLSKNNEILQKNNEIQRLELSRARLRSNVFIFGFLLLLIIGFLFIVLFFNFKK